MSIATKTAKRHRNEPARRRASNPSLFVEQPSGEPLVADGDTLRNSEGREVATQRDGVWNFLGKENSFYEGAYLNRIRYMPKTDGIFGRLPFFWVNNGYIWEVCKHFQPESRILEMGCASGVDYLARRFEMVGLDFSFESLRQLNGYGTRVQADAERLPFAENSFDGAISSYFWEHIAPDSKDRILTSLRSCLKSGGKLVFLYDVATDNALIKSARRAAPELYQERFLDQDGHIGYETVQENDSRFKRNGFRVIKQIGMERTPIQSVSVYTKLKDFPGVHRSIGRFGSLFAQSRMGVLINQAIVRSLDVSVGKLFPIGHSRILMTVAEAE